MLMRVLPRRDRLTEVVSGALPIRLVAGATLLNGLWSIGQTLLVGFPGPPRLLTLILPFGLHHWGRSLTVALGFLLSYLSLHLFRRSAIAWWLATVIAVLAVLGPIAWGNPWYTALAPAVTTVLLIALRRRFTVRSEPRSIRHGLELMAASVLLAVAYGTFGFWILDPRDLGLNFHLGDALLRTLREFTLAGNPDLVARTSHARWFLDSLRLLGVVAALVGAVSLFRPVAYRLRTLPAERALVRDILSQHGRSALDFFKLWPDKSYFFSETRRSVVAYRTALGVALSLGDPVGPDEELEGTVGAFLHVCSDNGWKVAFHQVPPDLLGLYDRLGFQALKIGEVAVVDLEHFATHTVARREFRRARNRFREAGYTVVRHVPPHAPSLLDQVEEVSDEWLSLPGRREREFTLGRFERSYVGSTPLVALHAADGHVAAFVNEIPAYQPGQATIDLMRHRADLAHGAMDYLVVELLLLLKGEGYRSFNLGLAPFAGVGDRPGATLYERTIHQLFEHLNRFFSYAGLRHYKAKFEPAWEDRFLVYQGAAPGLVKAALAVVRATEG
jgi:phosphatidylglycerol lysyltransferase